MAAGTAAALVPIKSITMRSRNGQFEYLSDEPGPVCLRLLQTLQGIQRGTIKDTFGWLESVQEAKRADWEQSASTKGVAQGAIDKLP